MTILIWIGIFFILIFSFVVAFGAPFLPTLKARTPEVFELLNLRPGQTLLELGSGDGRILRAAAERGIYAIGYELNPVLVLWSRLQTWRYRKLVTVHWGNYWMRKLPQTDAIYVFLLNPYMKKLDTKIIQDTTKKVKVVSFAFEIPGRTAIAQKNGLFLYIYGNEKREKRKVN